MYIGFDTSNYTTSGAVFDGNEITQYKKMLTVKPGERGLRQSDAVFQHTVNMPELINEMSIKNSPDAVGVSSRPRNIQGSYMPCFLVGINTAASFAKASGCSLYKTSHQTGHILAALYSCKRLDLTEKEFISFHISGGTTEALLCTPDSEEIIKARIVAQSLDLKAGQAIDRAGVYMGLEFPCGAQLEKLSALSDKEFKIKPALKGSDCSLSGVENKVKQMLDDGWGKPDISKFVLTYICETVDVMTAEITDRYGDLPIVCAGGVMSNSLIKNRIINKYGAFFAEPQFSCDNAAGTAIYAYLKETV